MRTQSSNSASHFLDKWKHNQEKVEAWGSKNVQQFAQKYKSWVWEKKKLYYLSSSARDTVTAVNHRNSEETHIF